jgi:hypothetical protein
MNTRNMRNCFCFFLGVAVTAACVTLLRRPCGVLPADQQVLILGNNTTNGTQADPSIDKVLLLYMRTSVSKNYSCIGHRLCTHNV